LFSIPVDVLARTTYPKKVIPLNLRVLFWDINRDTFDPLAFPEYTIGRVLEYGDKEAVAWVQHAFTEAQIVEVIKNERRLSRRSANFWALAYGLHHDQVAALKLAS
jgi:hypothetical protein